VVAIARDEHKPYVAGDEGIGNGRDGPALEIGIEDRKIDSVLLVASNASSTLAASAATVYPISRQCRRQPGAARAQRHRKWRCASVFAAARVIGAFGGSSLSNLRASA